jgi:hypothetical protein
MILILKRLQKGMLEAVENKGRSCTIDVGGMEMKAGKHEDGGAPLPLFEKDAMASLLALHIEIPHPRS